MSDRRAHLRPALSLLGACVASWLLAACDPIRSVSTARTLRAPLDESCVLEALRAQDTVRAAGVTEDGQMWAELVLPEDLKDSGRGSTVNVWVRPKGRERQELEIAMVWIGLDASPAFRAGVQETIDELRDRVLERCAGE